ncbi:MAG TPA: hypothetical protein VFK33_13150 [Bacillales bacterium]|nr:hypothetical protein [Bacillales bacterium]
MTPNQMKQSLRIASQLLGYPDKHFQRNQRQMVSEIRHMHHRVITGYLNLFLYDTSNMEIRELQDLYVEAFGFGKKTGLYLTRDPSNRKAALKELMKIYAEAGWTPNVRPNFLPLLFTFASKGSLSKGMAVLIRYRFRIMDIMKGLEQINSPYMFVLLAIMKTIEEGIHQDKPGVVSFLTPYQKRT